MIVVQEKKNIREISRSFINGKFNQATMILEILKNCKPIIQETNLVVLSKFLDKNFENGIPVTMTYMTPNGSNDVGDVDHYDKNSISIVMVGQKSQYDFPISDIAKIYLIEHPRGTGFFCMGKRQNSIYLRDY